MSLSENRHAKNKHSERIKIQLTKNKITVRENLHVLQFFKKNITATEVCFFANKGKETVKTTKITFAAEELESILFRNKGLSVLSNITSEEINVGHMAVIDTAKCLSNEEKEEIRKKVFVIR
ncbi:MAG: uncharacterized protein A8A55_3327, partial [Amphiamblys sp. WSBS2006]